VLSSEFGTAIAAVFSGHGRAVDQIVIALFAVRLCFLVVLIRDLATVALKKWRPPPPPLSEGKKQYRQT